MRPMVLAAAAISGGLSVGALAHPAQVIEQILVKVNGDIITRRQLDERVRSMLAQRQGRPLAGDEVRADEALRQQAEALTPRAISDAIDELLVLQRARELDFDVGDDDVDRVIARMRLDNNITSDAAFGDLLREQGIQSDALRESIANQILIEQVRQDVFRRVTVSQREAEEHYRAHVGEFAAGPAVVFRELLVALPPLEETEGSAVVAQEYDRGVIKFVRARDRITAGEDFAEVARTMSDAPSRESGGAVGPIDPRALPEAVRSRLAALTVGAVSAPVRTAEGYRLLKLENVIAPRPPTFETFRESIVADLLAQKRTAAFAAQLRLLRARSLMDWKDRAVQAAYDRLVHDR
jgi:peptidyl-prolyl cis-trans isomerase SurA